MSHRMSEYFGDSLHNCVKGKYYQIISGSRNLTIEATSLRFDPHERYKLMLYYIKINPETGKRESDNVSKLELSFKPGKVPPDEIYQVGSKILNRIRKASEKRSTKIKKR